MNLVPYRHTLGLVGTGILVWILGLVVEELLPRLTAVGVVLVMFGQVIFWIGVVILVVQVFLSIIRGSGL